MIIRKTHTQQIWRDRHSVLIARNVHDTQYVLICSYIVCTVCDAIS